MGRKVMAIVACLLGAGLLQGQVYNILDYGAKGDGATLCTQAIQSALDDCREAGGGTVLVPAGRFLSGTVRVYSHTTLTLGPGAVLLGSAQWSDYDPDRPHLIWGDSLNSFTLNGAGTIDGQGEAFFDKSGRGSWRAQEGARPRPWINLMNSRKVSITGLSFVNSPAHVLNFSRCELLFIQGIRIENDMRSPNTDGIDLKGCRNVLISDCFVKTGDDAICLKSSKDTVENVAVTNCILISDDAALKFGTGSAYPIRNCQFSNIAISGTRYGIGLFMTQGGLFERCQFSNILIETGSRHATEYPIYMDIDKRSATASLGQIRDIAFSQLNISTRGNILIGGQPGHPITGISFKDVSITFPDLSDLTALGGKPRGNKSFPKLPGMADYARVPAHFTLCQVERVQLDNIRFVHQFSESPHARHFIHLESAKEVRLRGLQWPAPMPGRQAISRQGEVQLLELDK